MGSFVHWLNVELWSPMWPNALSPNFWTIVGIVLSHLHLHRKIRKNHDELMGRNQ